MTKVRKKIGTIPINDIEQQVQQSTSAAITQMQQDVSDFIDEETAQYPEIGGTFKYIEDPEGRTEIKTDSEGKILSYRDSDGIVHECGGLESISLKGIKTTDSTTAKTLFEQIKANGYNLMDWSDELSLRLPIPKCAKINFIIPNSYIEEDIQRFKANNEWPNILLPKTKTQDMKCHCEYWDMLGNYFKKAVVINAQGNSSLLYKVKNLTLDLDDGSEIFFGNWVGQDSFHMKFYYQDFFNVYCIAAYRIGEELIKYKGCRSNRNKTGKSDANWNFGGTTNTLVSNIDSGALCHPDGFSVEVYVNGEYQGLYTLQLKKHRKNYDMDKKNYNEVLIDNMRSFTEPLWTGDNAMEIKNPKTLICMDGSKYDDDDPKELIDSTSEHWNNSKDQKNTVKTKNEILRLCSSMATITADANPTQKFLEYFDKEMLEVYHILIELLYGYDNEIGNWVWTCYNKIWAPNFYDLDTTCGKSASGTLIQTRSTTHWLAPDANTNPLGFVWANYRTEIVSLWNELRTKKIIDTENLLSFYKKIISDTGISAYERSYEKYPEMPSYRDSTLNEEITLSNNTKVKRSDYWEVVEERQDWNRDESTFDSTRMYVVGDTCKILSGLYNHVYFRCKQDLPEAGIAPMHENLYSDIVRGYWEVYPQYQYITGGFYDSIDRIKKWFDERIAFLDTQYVNN